MAQQYANPAGGRTTAFRGGSITHGPFGGGGGGGDNPYTVQAALAQQPGVFANAFGNNFGAMAGGLTGVGKSYADAFGAYNLGLGNIATAKANEAGARYGANAMAEAARQAALSNVGTAQLGAYGSAANSALAAWAANQQAYNQSLASMQNANQQGMANVGVSQNAALGGLGGAYGSLGRASALSNLNMSMSGGGVGGGDGGGFAASGPEGGIASGSYGGGGGSGGLNMSLTANRSSANSGMPEAYAGLDALRMGITSGSALDRLAAGDASSRAQLDAQHYSSRGMPSQMMNDVLAGLTQLGTPAYAGLDRGMNQFYDNNQADFSMFDRLAGQMKDGFGTVGGQLRGVQGDLRTGYGTANNLIGGMWDKSLGNLPMFQDPAEVARRATLARQQQDAARRQSLADSRARRAERRRTGTPWWKA